MERPDTNTIDSTEATPVPRSSAWRRRNRYHHRARRTERSDYPSPLPLPNPSQANLLVNHRNRYCREQIDRFDYRPLAREDWV
eukprot:scaffold1147_cov172-Amphora_coffeaeformis.AAC.18